MECEAWLSLSRVFLLLSTVCFQAPFFPSSTLFLAVQRAPPPPQVHSPHSSFFFSYSQLVSFLSSSSPCRLSFSLKKRELKKLFCVVLFFDKKKLIISYFQCLCLCWCFLPPSTRSSAAIGHVVTLHDFPRFAAATSQTCEKLGSRTFQWEEGMWGKRGIEPVGELNARAWGYFADWGRIWINILGRLWRYKAKE